MTKGKCPTCRGEAIREGNKLWPFCSERCHLVDLGRWLGEEYRIPEDAARSRPDQDPPREPTTRGRS